MSLSLSCTIYSLGLCQWFQKNQEVLQHIYGLSNLMLGHGSIELHFVEGHYTGCDAKPRLRQPAKVVLREKKNVDSNNHG